MAIYQKNDKAVYTGNSYGPIFGDGHDLSISNGCNSGETSTSELGVSYKLPSGYTPYTDRSHNLLAGSRSFKCDDYEVFHQWGVNLP